MATWLCILFQRNWTDPSSLICDPLGDLFRDYELNDKTDNVGEETTNPPLDDGHCHPVSEAQQGHDSTPAHIAITKQPKKTTMDMLEWMLTCVMVVYSEENCGCSPTIVGLRLLSKCLLSKQCYQTREKRFMHTHLALQLHIYWPCLHNNAIK